MRTDPGSDLTTECTEETQKHTDKKKKKKKKEKEKKKKGCERALTRISRKTRKDANEFSKNSKFVRAICFSLFFVLRSVFLCEFSVYSVVKLVRSSRMDRKIPPPKEKDRS